MSLLLNNAVLIGGGAIDEFIITVKTDNICSSNDNQFYLPIIGWSALNTVNGLTVEFGTSKYSTSAAAARASLITDDSWTINDGGAV